ncbi:MAG: hypothetical protein IPJ28_12025 [Betaproteobacteria bacterium]|nr:hypothetical protein [Betaproteobacteria bacterium]
MGTPPSTATEQRLAGIWREQLKVPQVCLEDNFFDLGGHSLLAMQAILAMETSTGKRIDRNRYIFESLAQIARPTTRLPPRRRRRSRGAARPLLVARRRPEGLGLLMERFLPGRRFAALPARGRDGVSSADSGRATALFKAPLRRDAGRDRP